MTATVKRLYVCKNCGMGVSAQETPDHCLKCKHKFSADLDETVLFWPVSPKEQVALHNEFESEKATAKNEDRESDTNPIGPIINKIKAANSKKLSRFLLETDPTSIQGMLESIEELYAISHGSSNKSLLIMLIAHADNIAKHKKKLEAMRESGATMLNYKELFS